MVRKCSRDRRLQRALCGGFFGGASVQDRHMGAGLQLVLPVGNDLLVGAKARVDECLALADLRHLDWADCYRAVRIDHIGVGSLRPLLYDRCGNGQAVMPRIEQHPRVDKLTRPQQMLLVGKLRSQPDRTGGLDDLVIDEVKRALIELLAVLTVNEDGDRSLRKALLDGYEICLRQREDQGDRLDLRDVDQAVDVGGINDVAYIDLPNTGYPIDRRREIGVSEVYPRAFNDRFVRLDHGNELVNDCLLGVRGLRGDRFLLSKLGVSIEVDLGVLQVCLIAVAIGDRLIELGLIRTWVDLANEIVLLHGLPLFESNLNQLPGNLAAHDDVVEGNDGTDAPQVYRNVVALHRRCDDADRRRRCGRRRRHFGSRVVLCRQRRGGGGHSQYRDYSDKFGGRRFFDHSLLADHRTAGRSTGGGTGVRAWHRGDARTAAESLCWIWNCNAAALRQIRGWPAGRGTRGLRTIRHR